MYKAYGYTIVWNIAYSKKSNFLQMSLSSSFAKHKQVQALDKKIVIND